MHPDLLPRPALTSPAAIAAALDRLPDAAPADVWRALTERFTVDLDAAAAILPTAAPEPSWLRRRG